MQETAPDATLRFCCRGCHGAYLLISGAGLADFYRRRDWQEPGLAADSFQSGFSDPYLARFVHPAGAASSMRQPSHPANSSSKAQVAGIPSATPPMNRA